MLLVACVAAGCDRPFIEEIKPEVTVVSPRLTDVQTGDSLTLVVRAATFRAIARVEANGRVLVRTNDSLWTGRVGLVEGLNRLRLTATDEGGVARTTTAYALRLRLTVQALTLAVGRSGHTTTRLQDGRLLVIGGVTRTGTSARNEAFLVDPVSFATTPIANRMNVGRTGHTATLLPNGKVLILGGTRVDGSRALSELVQTAELYDPTTTRFSAYTLRGAGIQNAYHQTLLRRTADGGVYVAVIGGEGAPSGSSSRTYGERDDVRVFEVTDAELVATTGASSGYGRSVGERMSGFSATPLTAATEAGGDGRAMVAAAQRQNTSTPNVVETLPLGFALDLSGINVSPDEAAAPNLARHRHAAARLADSLVLVAAGARDAFSGIVPPTNDLVGGAEVYAAGADRFFALPLGALLRYGLTATALPGGRVVLVGGMGDEGNALSSAIVVTTSLR